MKCLPKKERTKAPRRAIKRVLVSDDQAGRARRAQSTRLWTCQGRQEKRGEGREGRTDRRRSLSVANAQASADGGLKRPSRDGAVPQRQEPQGWMEERWECSMKHWTTRLRGLSPRPHVDGCPGRQRLQDAGTCRHGDDGPRPACGPPCVSTAPHAGPPQGLAMPTDCHSRAINRSMDHRRRDMAPDSRSAARRNAWAAMKSHCFRQS